MSVTTVHTSRGALVKWWFMNALPMDTVELSSEGITLRPRMRRPLNLARSAILRVEYDRVRRPLNWSNDFYFRMVDGTRAPKLFRPLRTRRFIQMLGELGYEVADLAEGTKPDADTP